MKVNKKREKLLPSIMNNRLFPVLILILSISFITGCIENNLTNQSEASISREGLIGCWMFDEVIWKNDNNITIDCSTNENHALVINAHLEINQTQNSSYAFFNSSDQYFHISSTDYNEENITIESWVKSSNPGNGSAYILSKGSQGCNLASYAFFTDTNDGICFYVSDGSKILKSPNPGSIIWDNKWHHIVGTYDGRIIRLFIDGKEIQNGTLGSISINYNLTTNNDLIIGNYIGSCSLPYTGFLDDVMIWNRVLSNQEIYHHFLSSSLHDPVVQSEPQYVSLSDARTYLRTYLSPYNQNDIIIIKGSKLSIQDNLILTTITSQMENTEDVKTIMDTTAIQNNIKYYPLIILLGSEKTNTHTNYLQSSSLFQQTSQLISPAFVFEFGILSSTNQNVLIFYTLTEKENKQNHAAEKSPLNGLIDKKYIPAIATSTSILLLYLWSIIGNTLSEFIFDFISEHITERKIKRLRKYAEKQLATKKRKIIHETIALILSIIVFSLAMSWTWSENINQFISLMTINLTLISLIFLIREGIRTSLSRKYTIDTAHVFWPFGSILTLGSTILGNTFSLASFTMLTNEEDQKMYGKMYYFIFRILYLICIICFIFNFFYPSLFFQMTYVFIIMSLFIDMTPLEPMDGKDVKEWNKRRWAMFYILVIFSYLIMNFSINLSI